MAQHLTLAPFVAVAWVCAAAYETLVGRRMPPMAYGTLETATGILVVVGAVASAAQLWSARAASRGWPLTRSMPPSTLAGAVGGVAAATGAAAALLPLHLPFLVAVWVGAVALAWLVLGLVRGWAQGQERYGALGASLALEGVARLAALAWGATVWGPPGALGATATAAVVAILPVWPRRVRAHVAGRPPSLGDLPLLAAGTLLTSLLPVLPLLLLRGRLAPVPFAALAAALLLVRAQVEVAGWLSLALFPRLVAAPREASWAFPLTAALGMAVGLAMAGAAALAMPELVRWAFRGRYLAQLAQLRLAMFTALPTSLFGLWVTRAMALESRERLGRLALALPLTAAFLLAQRPSFEGAAVSLAIPATAMAFDSLWPLGARQRHVGRRGKGAKRDDAVADHAADL